MEKLKIKPLTKEQLTISINRLTRFKNPEIKYLRVFKDILTNNLIHPKYKKQELDEMDYLNLKDLAQEVINFSLECLHVTSNGDFSINQQLFDYENHIFKLSSETEHLLKNKINYKGFLNILEDNTNLPINLQWLKALDFGVEQVKNREEKSLHFPIEKLIICEGITEETLLPEFAKIHGYDFDKNGIHVISAGGKNQVVKTFYQLSETLKIPIFILLDSDAAQNFEEIKPKLRAIDEFHLIQCGEFEDLLPQQLVENTLNYALKNVSFVDFELLNSEIPRVKILEEIFKTRGLHEFKKSEFAQFVKANIKDESDLSDEIKDILNKLKNKKGTISAPL